VENHDLFCFFSGKTINDSTHLSKGSVWPRKYGALGLSTYIAIGATKPRFSKYRAFSIKGGRPSAELAFKLITLAALASQAALLIYGYSILVGRYEQFGIDINELALGTPTLLICGYAGLFSRALSAASQLPIIGPSLLALEFVLAAAGFVSLITKRLAAGIVVGLSAWIGMFLFVAFSLRHSGFKEE
jgi:hypothetical protein